MGRRAHPALLLALAAAAPAPAGLDDLYARLAAAPSRAAAAALEGAIAEQSDRRVAPTAAVLLDAAHAEGDAQPAKAVADAGAAIDLQPELPALWRERAIARLRAGDGAGAVDDLGHAIDLDSRDVLSWETLSAALENRGDIGGALAAWKRVLVLDPHAENARHRLDSLTRKAEGEHA